MLDNITRSGSSVIPCVKYSDARAAIEQPIVDEPYGGRRFTCRDPEGHVWSIGSYDPWARST